MKILVFDITSYHIKKLYRTYCKVNGLMTFCKVNRLRGLRVKDSSQFRTTVGHKSIMDQHWSKVCFEGLLLP